MAQRKGPAGWPPRPRRSLFFPFPPADRRRRPLAGLGGDPLRRDGALLAAAAPEDAAAAAAVAVSAAGKRPHPFQPLSRKKKKNLGKMLGERALQKKNHLLSSARAAGSSPSLFLLPPPAGQLLPPPLLGNSRTGPRWVQVLGSWLLAVLTLVASFGGMGGSGSSVMGVRLGGGGVKV